ncbi:uncharacterized protein KNAG_0F01140 [Huiozyma naganishii CBS 8797]|uniref:Uncharacterized protein n=1 Tax=Huiozyma naganishii (strain ATCC MYA-139 / BCRC 22969 / CBS 8797 / KCTC 17520 / NBRC 10181 / NCYC 3082 / Yp74L-3) TaxID=1071383 RepID=J7RZV6_HUIN7|nr:hypothetical protein KNAG_0F01140 [Kazachstania naganishii CBS 8797]CCK70782.1 hypothetical protein KNAG_0F01140 [Kazachstania naganishii CBS 8797]
MSRAPAMSHGVEEYNRILGEGQAAQDYLSKARQKISHGQHHGAIVDQSSRQGKSVPRDSTLGHHTVEDYNKILGEGQDDYEHDDHRFDTERRRSSVTSPRENPDAYLPKDKYGNTIYPKVDNQQTDIPGGMEFSDAQHQQPRQYEQSHQHEQPHLRSQQQTELDQTTSRVRDLNTDSNYAHTSAAETNMRSNPVSSTAQQPEPALVQPSHIGAGAVTGGVVGGAAGAMAGGTTMAGANAEEMSYPNAGGRTGGEYGNVQPVGYGNAAPKPEHLKDRREEHYGNRGFNPETMLDARKMNMTTCPEGAIQTAIPGFEGHGTPVPGAGKMRAPHEHYEPFHLIKDPNARKMTAQHQQGMGSEMQQPASQYASQGKHAMPPPATNVGSGQMGNRDMQQRQQRSGQMAAREEDPLLGTQQQSGYQNAAAVTSQGQGDPREYVTKTHIETDTQKPGKTMHVEGEEMVYHYNAETGAQTIPRHHAQDVDAQGKPRKESIVSKLKKTISR